MADQERQSADALVLAAERFARECHEGDSSGHDYWHVERVRRLALHLAAVEGADRLPVELAALLHDVGDRKLAGREFRLEDHPANLWLLANGVDAELRLQVMEIVLAVSFKGAGVETRPDTLAAQVVQDADRLDAIGALGIARTFAYGGARGQAMHDPGRPPQLHQTAAAYARGSTTSINHFYEKLLLLGERLNTRRAKEIARQRHEFMQNFLRQFLSEWQGEDYLRPGR